MGWSGNEENFATYIVECLKFVGVQGRCICRKWAVCISATVLYKVSFDPSATRPAKQEKRETEGVRRQSRDG